MRMPRCLIMFLVAPFLLAACSRPPEPAPTQPAPRPAPPPVGDFPAFGGGGPLLNAAPEIGAPPMKVRWTHQAPDACNAAPVICDDAVYIADSGGTLVSLDLATGKERWSFHSARGFDATPLVIGDALYIGDMSGTFFAIHRATGAKLWTFAAQSPVHAGANGDGTHILFGTDSGLILCLDGSGNKTWSAQAEGRINAPPALRGGLAAFTSCDAHLRQLRLENGAEVFSVDLGNLAAGSACAGEKALYVGTDQGHVLALAAADGRTLWHFDGVAENAMVYASPALAGDTLVVAARDQHAYALGAIDGSRRWSFAAGADIDASPVISGGRVYLAGKDRRLYVLDLATGRELWKFETARPIAAPVAIARGVLVAGDAGGTVYCLEPH
jgi:outer membrane protein assembly factor BamB